MPSLNLPYPCWASKSWAEAEYAFEDEREALQYALHREVLDFVEYVDQMTAAQAPTREEALLRLKNMVAELWPEAKVATFGSTSTNLHLPHSDIDILLEVETVPQGSEGAALATLASRLMNGVASNVTVYGHAAVPVLKYCDLSGVMLDVCINVKGGLENSDFVRKQMELRPEVRPLALVVKTLLAQHNLNEVYTGGLSSHSIVLLIISFLQMQEEADPCPEEEDEQGGGTGRHGMLGLHLLNFFLTYGFQFPFDTMAISLHHDGGYVPKAAKQWGLHPNRDRIAIEDPFGGHNAAAGSFNLAGIQEVFRFAFDVLSYATENGLRAFERWVPTLLSSLISPWAYSLVPCGPVRLPAQSASGSEHSRSSVRSAAQRARVPVQPASAPPAESTPAPAGRSAPGVTGTAPGKTASASGQTAAPGRRGRGRAAGRNRAPFTRSNVRWQGGLRNGPTPEAGAAAAS